LPAAAVTFGELIGNGRAAAAAAPDGVSTIIAAAAAEVAPTWTPAELRMDTGGRLPGAAVIGELIGSGTFLVDTLGLIVAGLLDNDDTGAGEFIRVGLKNDEVA